MRRVIEFKGGEKVNQLTIIEKDESLKENHWKCKCDCGRFKSIKAKQLDRKSVKSCGCVKGFHHDYVGTSLYCSWSQMKERCGNPNNKSYSYYGKKGITYTKEWKEFIPFKDWALANGYKKGLTLDRINNSRGYSPENCRWATRLEQSRNQERIIVYNGEIPTDASKRLGGCEDLVSSRIRKGWTIKKAFTLPVRVWH